MNARAFDKQQRTQLLHINVHDNAIFHLGDLKVPLVRLAVRYTLNASSIITIFILNLVQKYQRR